MAQDPKTKPEDAAAVATAAEAAKVAADKKAKTEGDKPLSENAMKFMEESIGAVKKKKPDEKPEDAAEKEKAKKAAEDKAKADADKEKDKGKEKEKPKAAPKQKVAPRQPAAVDTKELATAVATAVVEATNKGKEKQKETTEVEPLFDTPEAKKELRKMALLEKAMPDKYKGRSEIYKQSAREWQAYADKWEKDHPGETFEDGAEEHRSKLEALESKWDYDNDDYVEALTDEKAEARVDKKLKPINERLGEFDRREKLQAEQPKIEAAQAVATTSFFTQIADEFPDIVKDGKIDPAKLKEFEEQNPDAHEEAMAAVGALQTYAAGYHRLFNQLEPYDKTNPLHVELSTFLVRAEQAMLKKAPDAQLDEEGRQFVTNAQYDKMDARQQAAHWTYGADDLTHLLSRNLAREAKKNIALAEEKFARRAKSAGLEYEPRRTNAANGKNGEHEKTAREQGKKPDSPTTASVTRTAAAKAKPGDASLTKAETWLNSM